MNFNKNDLMDALHSRFFESWAITLDVSDYVPEEYLEKVENYIFKNLKKQWKKIDKEDRLYQKSLKEKKRVEKGQLPAAEMHVGSAEESDPA